MTSFGVADDLVIHSFIGAPYLSNHLRYLPILQSVVFSALKGAGPVLTFNLLLIVSQVASQLMLFWFFIRKGITGWWAALAATAFVISPWYSTMLSQADLIAVGWWLPPLALIIWDRWLEKLSPWRTGAVTVVLYAAVLCGIQNIMWIAGLWLPYAAWSFWQRSKADPEFLKSRSDHLAGLGLTLMVLLLIYPTPVLVRSLQREEPAYGPALGEPVLRSFIGWILRTGPAIFGLTAVTGVLAKRERGAAGWLGVAGLNAAVGFGVLPDPLNMIAGALGLTYWPLAEREFFFGIAIFAMLVYISRNWTALQATKDDLGNNQRPILWTGVWIAVLVGLVGTNLTGLRTLPNHEVIVPAFYQEIATEPEDYIVLEYPFGVSSVADGRTMGQAAYLAQNAVWDSKRPTSGLATYYEPHIFDKMAATTFLFPEALTQDNQAQAAEALGIAVREWRIGYVVMHPDLLSAEMQAAIRKLAEQSQALCPPVEREGLVIFRAQWHPYGCPAQ